MKKRYSVTLDETEAEVIKAALFKSNMTLSSFVNMSVHEFYDNLQELAEIYKKNPADLTVPEFLSAITEMIERSAKRQEKEEKK